MRRRAAGLMLGLLATTCGGGRPIAAGSTVPCLYLYSIDTTALPALRIQATFAPGGSPDLVIAPELSGAITRVEVKRGDVWEIVSSDNGTWRVPECAASCTIRYELAIDRGRGGEDGVATLGASWLSPTYAWLLHPTPVMKGRFELTITPASAPSTSWSSAQWAAGFRDLGDGRRGFLSGDFAEGAFVGFGKLRTRNSQVDGGEITAVLLDGKLAMSETEAARWVDDAASAVAMLYGRFPVRHATVFLAPIPAATEPVFGRVLSLGGSSVLVLTGEESDGNKMHDDWILVHELIHLGFPTFQNEGRWLDEGIATYYEPVLRTRMGWRDKTDLWRGLAREMPRGLASEGEPLALEKRTTLDGIYWGGALFVMMADVRIREETRGQKSLDDVLRGVLAKGGDGEHVWTVAETMRVGDALTGTHVLTNMYKRFALEGEAVDLEAELHALGIDRTGVKDEISLHDDRPRASMRSQIVSRDGRTP